MQRKFFLDENVMPIVADALSRLFKDHRFVTAKSAGLLDVKDVPLFYDLRDRDIDAIITQDLAQLSNDAERQALRECNLHHIGFVMPKASGQRMAGAQMATLALAIPEVLEQWADQPTSYLIRPANLGSFEISRI